MSDYVTKTNLLSALGRFKENTDNLYGTKAEASDLKSALTQLDHRVENLEQAVSGSLVQTNTDSTQKNTKSITSANTILPWALLNRVGARATQFNQIMVNGNFSSSSNWYAFGDVTFSVTNNVCKVTSQAVGSGQGMNYGINMINGHKYFVACDVKAETTGHIFGVSFDVSTVSTNKAIDLVEMPTSWTRVYGSCVITSSARDGFHIAITSATGMAVGDFFSLKNVVVMDMTAMGEASTSDSDFFAKFPASYYPYNTGEIIPLNPSAFKVVGKNKIDISTMVRTDKDGTPINGWLRWTSLVKYESAQTYYMKCNTLDFTVFSFQIFFYDADGIFISGNSSNKYINPNTGFSFTLPSVAGAFYFSVGFYHSSSLASYTPTNVLLCLNSVTDKTYEAYSETTIDTSFTSDYNYVNPSCYDYSENILVDGQKIREEHRIVRSVDLGTLDFNIQQEAIYYCTIPDILQSRYVNMIIGNNYTQRIDLYSAWTDVDKVYAGRNNYARVYFKDTSLYDSSKTTEENIAMFKSAMNGVILNYELANPTTSLHNDPIPNFPCEDGTTITAITPQTELVNAIDVPTTIAYMTKAS